MQLLREMPDLCPLSSVQMGEGLPSSFPKAAGMIVPLKSGENQHLHVCSPPHYRLSKNDEICRHKQISLCPSFFPRTPSLSGAPTAGGRCGRTNEVSVTAE